MIVLFDDHFRVWRATHLPVALLEQDARLVEHVRGFRVMATDALLDRGEDWTERLRDATAEWKALMLGPPIGLPGRVRPA